MTWYAAVGTALGVMFGLLLGLVCVTAINAGSWISPLSFMSGGLDSGWAALLGGLIGAGATAVVAIYQIKNSARQNILDSKREAYAKGLAALARAGVAVAEGKTYPSDYGVEEVGDFHTIMAELTLMSADEVEEVRKRFHAAYPDSIPKSQEERMEKYFELREISKELRKAMQKELGIVE